MNMIETITPKLTLSDKTLFIKNENETYSNKEYDRSCPNQKEILLVEDIIKAIKEFKNYFKLWRLKSFGTAGMSQKFDIILNKLNEIVGDKLC